MLCTYGAGPLQARHRGWFQKCGSCNPPCKAGRKETHLGGSHGLTVELSHIEIYNVGVSIFERYILHFLINFSSAKDTRGKKEALRKRSLFIYLNKKLASSFPPSDAVGLGSRVGSRQWDIFHCNTISFALPVDLGQVNGRLVAVR